MTRNSSFVFGLVVAVIVTAGSAASSSYVHAACPAPRGGTVLGAEGRPVALSPEAAAVHRELQQLAREVDASREKVRESLSEGASPPRTLASGGKRRAEALRRMESSLLRLQPEEAHWLATKIAAIRLHAAGRRGDKAGLPVSAPPPPPTPSRRLDLQAMVAADACADALPIGFETVAGDTLTATNDGSASCGGSSDSPDVWFRFHASSYGYIVISTVGSDYDTVLSVHTGCPTDPTAMTRTCNDDAVGLQSIASVWLSQGEEVLIRVSGAMGATGHFVLTVGNPGVVHGTVTDAATGDPVVGATVSAYTTSTGAWLVDSDETGADGSYTLSSYYPTTLVVAAADPEDGYRDELFEGVSCVGGPGVGCSSAEGTVFDTREPDTVAVADFALQPAAGIAGDAVDADTGQPLTGWLYVSVFDETGNLVRHVDAAGPAFEVKELEPGTYFARLFADHYESELFDGIPCGQGCDPATGTPIAVRPGQTTHGVSFALPRRSGGISGHVTDARTGAPLGGATLVSLLGEDGTTIATSNVSYWNGQFSFSNLALGRYYVQVEADCYVDTLYPDVACEGGVPAGCTLGEGVALELTAAQPEISNADLSIAPGGYIAGRIRDQLTGAAVAGARVGAWSAPRQSWVSSATSDATGAYTLECLDSGAYLVMIREGGDYIEELYDDVPCPGGTLADCDPALGTEIAVDIEHPAAGVDFSLLPGSTIHGAVSDETSGAPLSGVGIEAWDEESTPVSYATTAADGTYSLSGLTKPGRYFVTAASSSNHLGGLYDGLPCPTGPPQGCEPQLGTAVEIPSGPPRQVWGIDFALVRAGSLTGRITARGTGGPLPGVPVKIWNELGASAGSTRTGGDGSYSLSVPGGLYYVTADAYSGYLGELYDGQPCDLGPPNDCAVTAGTPVTVELGHTTAHVDLALRRGATVGGEVRDPDSGQAVWSSVSAWRDGTRVGMGQPSNGLWTITGLPAGEYRFVLEPSFDHLGQVYDGIDCTAAIDCSAALGTPVAVAVGSVIDGIDFSPKGYGSVLGVVSHEGSGEPIAGVVIRAFDATGALVDSAYSQVSGAYEINSLFPGSYVVEASSNEYVDEVFRDVECAGACPHDGAEVVQVQAARQTRHVDFGLRRRGSVSGRLTDFLTSEPVAGATVFFYLPDGSLAKIATTGSDGTYRASGLSPASYAVLAKPPLSTAYFPELWNGVTCFDEPTSLCLGDATPLALDAEQELAGIDFALKREGSIRGTVVTNATGAPVHGEVSAYDAETLVRAGWTLSSATTGEFTIGGLPWGSYVLFVDGPIVPELYDDIACPGGIGAGCTLSAGTPVAVTRSAPEATVAVAVDRYGMVSGSVVDAASGNLIHGDVTLYDATGVPALTMWNAPFFRFTNLEAGTYYLAATSAGKVAQMYDGVPCAGNDLESCDLALATPIEVGMNNDGRGFDFALSRIEAGPPVTVTASVTAERTGLPIAGATIRFYDDNYQWTGSCTSDSSGTCRREISAGTYVAFASAAGYETELYDDIACLGTCSLSKGTPFTLGDGQPNAVSFALRDQPPAIEGTVSTREGSPLALAIVDAWSAVDGSWVDAATADGDGRYLLPLPPGTYHLSTDNGQGLMDEVYDDVACPDGPAYAGLCDPERGAVVSVGDVLVTGVDFALGAGPDIFADGFESGLAPWARTVGN